MKTNILIRAVAVSVAGALLCGCGQSDSTHKTTSSPAPAVKTAATAPATRPAQDPREALILSDVTQLTFGFDKAGEAYFSPDMKWIVFQASPKGMPHYQMYVAPLKWEGDKITGIGQPTRVSPEPSRNTCGFFSPDGRSLLFASTAGKEDPTVIEGGYQRKGGDYRWAFPAGMEIYRSDDWQAQVQAAGGKDIDLAKHALTDNKVYDAEDSFSPDGKWIVFCSMRSGDGDVYIMRSDGTHPVRITSNPGYDGGPFFSPDGKHLVYRSDRNKNNLLQIFTADLAFDADGNITGISAEHPITKDANVNWGPFYYPDGQHIVYATSKHGPANYGLYVIRPDGTHDKRVTYAAGIDILPAFSPDGKWLMWTSKRSANKTTQIFVAKFHPPEGW
ncbi:MAG TPA: hypothetical protein VFE47_04465 [Tepidisphaeraceae bacterium]|jgi:Tol biopolymer transport system component|nr:hypothetical protein [Tepidisphaeraceae bacterium]